MRTRLASFVLLLLASGCASSSNDSADAHSPADAARPIDSWSFPDMPPPDAPLPDARPPDGLPFHDAAPAVADEGLVLLANVLGDDNALWTLTVKFVRGSVSGLSVWGRPLGTAGDCTAYAEDSDGGYSAGPVVTWGLGQEITWTPAGEAGHVIYTASAKNGAAFSPGTSFWLQAQDAAVYYVPNFAGSVAGPQAQSWITGVGSSFPRSVALELGWTAVPGERMLLVIRSQDPSSSDAVSVVCRFTDSDGTYTVSEAALVNLPVGNQGTIHLYRVYGPVATAGSFQVETLCGSAVRRTVTIEP